MLYEVLCSRHLSVLPIQIDVFYIFHRYPVILNRVLDTHLHNNFRISPRLEDPLLPILRQDLMSFLPQVHPAISRVQLGHLEVTRHPD